MTRHCYGRCFAASCAPYGRLQAVTNGHALRAIGVLLLFLAASCAPYGRLQAVNEWSRPAGDRGIAFVSGRQLCSLWSLTSGYEWSRPTGGSGIAFSMILYPLYLLLSIRQVNIILFLYGYHLFRGLTPITRVGTHSVG